MPCATPHAQQPQRNTPGATAPAKSPRCHSPMASRFQGYGFRVPLNPAQSKSHWGHTRARGHQGPHQSQSHWGHNPNAYARQSPQSLLPIPAANPASLDTKREESTNQSGCIAQPRCHWQLVPHLQQRRRQLPAGSGGSERHRQGDGRREALQLVRHPAASDRRRRPTQHAQQPLQPRRLLRCRRRRWLCIGRRAVAALRCGLRQSGGGGGGRAG
eukprot:355192-Chlamydomonas_euryale.AAC.6